MHNHLWLIIIKRGIILLKLQVPDDSVFAAIPIFHTSKFIVSDPTKFDFLVSVPEAMLLNVLTDNLLIKEYRKKPTSGPLPIPEDLRRALEERNKPKKGGKRKGRAGPSDPAQNLSKNIEKATRK